MLFKFFYDKIIRLIFKFYFMKTKIGVMGSSQGPTIENNKNLSKATEIGKMIAQNNCILVNGACPGLPNEAAIGAKTEGGFVLGISPAFSENEHLKKYKNPIKAYDLIIYTGMGLMERDILNIRSSDAIILVGGGIGTLNEFTVAFDEGKIVGVLTSSGGISEHIPDIVQKCNRNLGNRVLFSSNPSELVNKVLTAIKQLPSVDTEDERIIHGE